MKKILILIMLIPLLDMSAQSKVGTTSAPFLTNPVGSRAIGMGGAFVATSNDVTALHWNPAGIARIGGGDASFTRTNWFANITYNWAGATIDLGEIGAIGLNATYLDYGKMEVTTLTEYDGTGEYFSASDMVIGLTYSRNLTDRFAIGLTAKYVHQKIWNCSASTVAFDFGVLFISDIYGLRVGATITNFGEDMQLDGKDLYVQHDIDPNAYGNNEQILAKLKTDKFPLPLTFRVGLAIDPINIKNHRVTIGVDALHPNDNSESLNAGIEYLLYNIFALRAGYSSIFLDNDESGLTLGAGIRYEFNPVFGVYVDYAYQDFGILKYTQHFTLGIRF